MLNCSVEISHVDEHHAQTRESVGEGGIWNHSPSNIHKTTLFCPVGFSWGTVPEPIPDASHFPYVPLSWGTPSTPSLTLPSAPCRTQLGDSPRPRP